MHTDLAMLPRGSRNSSPPACSTPTSSRRTTRPNAVCARWSSKTGVYKAAVPRRGWKIAASCAASLRPPSARSEKPTASSGTFSIDTPPTFRPPSFKILPGRNPPRRKAPRPINRRGYQLNCYSNCPRYFSSPIPLFPRRTTEAPRDLSFPRLPYAHALPAPSRAFAGKHDRG